VGVFVGPVTGPPGAGYRRRRAAFVRLLSGGVRGVATSPACSRGRASLLRVLRYSSWSRRLAIRFPCIISAGQERVKDDGQWTGACRWL